MVKRSFRLDPHQRVDHAGDRHHDPAHQREPREPLRRQAQVVPAPVAQRQHRDQAADPEGRGDEVEQEAVGGDVVRAAARGVPGDRDRDQAADGQEEQHRRPAPREREPAAECDEHGDQGGPQPGLRLLDGADEVEQRLRIQDVAERLPGGVGGGEGDRQQRRGEPHPGGDPGRAQGTVALGAERAGLLRRHQERGQQQRPDADHRRGLRQHAHDRDAVLGHQARIRQAGDDVAGPAGERDQPDRDDGGQQHADREQGQHTGPALGGDVGFRRGHATEGMPSPGQARVTGRMGACE